MEIESPRPKRCQRRRDRSVVKREPEHRRDRSAVETEAAERDNRTRQRSSIPRGEEASRPKRRRERTKQKRWLEMEEIARDKRKRWLEINGKDGVRENRHEMKTDSTRFALEITGHSHRDTCVLRTSANVS